MAESAVAVALVYPDLLGTYGDGGNALILAQRLRWRRMRAEVVRVMLGTSVPAGCDVYVLGGGEDAPQELAARELRRSGALAAAVERGAAVLAVCAGLQIIGTRFLTGDGLRDGVGLVDAETARGRSQRAVGELAVEPGAALGLPMLSGYENHAGITRLGSGVQPLGRVVAGVGNGTDDRVDGLVVGRILGTYLHGPVLARNPELADLILGWVTGELPEGQAELVQADQEARALRAERLARVGAGARRPGGIRTWGRNRRYPWRPTPPS